jgi:hypothetical protein
MKLEYVPLLKLQRKLYDIPRGMDRFREYLATMIDPETRDMKLPLAAMNPMGREHLPALLDQYLSFDADGLAAQAVQEAEAQLNDISGGFKVALVIADDLRGGWTNRCSSEYGLRFGNQAYHKRGWVTGTLWTSEKPTTHIVRTEVLTAVFGTAYTQQHGVAKTLQETLAHAGYAMAHAGCTEPSLARDEIEYTREVLTPYLQTQNYPIIFACLFGDNAATMLGYDALGLSDRAGLALALHDAKKLSH